MKYKGNSKDFHLEGIGKIKLLFSDTAKYTKISINNMGDIILTIPHQIKVKHAIEFAISKKKWIKKNQKKTKDKNLLTLKLSHDKLEIFQQAIEKKTNELSKKYGLLYNQLIFKTLKSRWGSCSARNIICLNNLIYYLPIHLQEYVILHELMHTKIKNHSIQFWYELENICKNSKSKGKELRDNYLLG